MGKPKYSNHSSNVNSIFFTYLEEFEKKASSKGCKSANGYRKCISTLKKYPLPLERGTDAFILQNFGKKICKMLDSRLVEDAKKSGLEIKEFLQLNRTVEPLKQVSTSNELNIVRKEKLTKVKSMPIKKSTITNHKKSTDDSMMFDLKPDEYEIVLCVDNHEAHGAGDKKTVKDQLNKLQVTWDYKNLSIGDFAWVAREKTENNNPKELMIDYIIERKTASDLNQSIVDGRFTEQKVRLKNCGLKNVVYLIEDYKKMDHQRLPPKTLMQATINTQIINGFLLKFTNNSKETFEYLELVTRKLEEKFIGKTLSAVLNHDENETNLLTFNNFNNSVTKTKNLTATELFIKQMMQIKNVSYDKANSITKVYPTLSSLLEQYKKCENENECCNLVSKIKYGVLGRSIGKAISSNLYYQFN